MVILLSIFALLGWIVLIALFILLYITRKTNKVAIVLLLCISIFQLWFYFPQTHLFPTADYAPVSSIHIVIPASQSGIQTPTESQSSEIISICNRIYASRSAIQTIMNAPGNIGAELYVYFSGRGLDGSKTYLSCGSRNHLNLSGQRYHIWNAEGLSSRIFTALR